MSDAFTLFSKVWLRHARLARHLRRADYDQVVDGGANIGEFAALVRVVRRDVPLLCIEPHPRAAAILRRRGFDVIEAALWKEAGTAVLKQPTAASTSSTLVGPDQRVLARWTVNTVRLDQLPLTGEHILLKLDLQGAEEAALEGLGAMWSRLTGILLEVSYGPSATYESLRELLISHGFREAATFNELEIGDGVVEADKLFLRRRPSQVG
jgi:FkbM family methyltransferase